MSTFKARVLYDFQGEPNTAEMSITAGELLTVTRTDVGDGWWEGLNPKGESGLFPEAYVEKVETSSKPPNIPPPAPPSQPGWGFPGQQEPDQGGHDDDDWDEWDDDNTYESPPYSNNMPKAEGNTQRYTSEQNHNFTRQNTQQSDNVSLSGSMMGDNKGTITKKSYNIFSSAVRSGLEGYILGLTKEVSGTAARKPHIYRDSDDQLGRWEVLSNPYTVQIASPKKATKMGGLKSFIAYTLTPSFSNVEVSRRYKHFDWLHDRLNEKFNLIAIPPLPDKQVSGRYEEMFIEHRRAQLQEFINYMCRHPVLSTCDVWIHFLTCTDAKQWKQGKRNAERDQLIGASFCLCVEAPEKEIMPSLVEVKIDENLKYVEKMDQCIKNLMQTAQDQQKKCINMYKREFTRVGEAFFALGSAFEYNQQGMYSKASVDVKNIGSTYIMIGKLYEEQGKMDWLPLFDQLYIYKGITSNLPNVLQMQKMAEQKKKECERNNQLPQVALTDVRRRSDVITYTVFAELNHFQQERDQNLKRALKDFLQEQLNFYKNVVTKIEETLNQFE
ncbi:sorting nexin lst-4 isoform X1 [Dendroctonus ponderosae]|uniref:sorting nexin lst-4 isoform X1 n=1 Tax=Dendroctonus ponderosae TaxID=77166 RepID=UPI0020356A00|nr:sorting nexin lst-4 isoform X1 [Dendroctonus ponderosae]